MIKESYVRNATLIRAIDGDTFDIQVDLGFGMSKIERFRLLEVNAPEIVGENKVLGFISRDFVIDKLTNNEFVLISHQFKREGFRRYLADIYYIEDGEQYNLATVLLSNNLAVPYIK